MELSQKQIDIIDKALQLDNFYTEYQKLIKEIRHLLDHVIPNKESDIANKEKLLAKREFEIEQTSREKLNQLLKYEGEIKEFIDKKTRTFSWLAELIADYINIQDNKLPKYLETKKNPSFVSAEKVREISKEKRILVKQLMIAKYTINFYEKLFPFLTEYLDENIDELLLAEVNERVKEEVGVDPVRQFITAGEYENLSVTERNQKALDRYISSRIKNPQQLGRDYERYIGYIYEKKGYSVYYQGIFEGYEDLGRDLICKQQGKVDIVQCKYWANYKTIHENHINQLFGTTVKYYIDSISNNNKSADLSVLPELLKKGDIKPVFYTSAKLSDTAMKFALALGIEVHESVPLEKYPIIKCHTNKQSGEKIYHLPFDQMYDRTIIEEKYGEFYAMTINEAESKGFRRAWKWKHQE